MLPQLYWASPPCSKDDINTQEFSPPDNFYDNHIYRATERKILTGDTVTGVMKPETKGSEIATYRAKGSSIYPARIIDANWEKAMKQSVLRSIFGLIISIFHLLLD
jgi:hypothetical protein